ncbi:MAG: hypothetical protein ACOYVF_14680, partial [Candidatus Zixiibacteriota bacterium]
MIYKISLITLTITLILSTPQVFGQGTIYGTVTGSDMVAPADGELSFFSFLDNTDEEIRIETSDGAGYEGGNWYDDFQNYLTEAPGNPYDFYFYDFADGDGLHFEGAIPNNSFQEENINIAPVGWPQKPATVNAYSLDTTRIKISWFFEPSLTYHVYRRPAGSNGSFYRIDNPEGSLANPGVADSFYIDSTVFSASSYSYIVIAEDGSGNYSPHSEVVTAFVRIQQITLDSVTNASGPVNEYGFQDSIAAGKDVTFYFRLTSYSGDNECTYGIGAGFRVYSEDEASWTFTEPDTVGILTDIFGGFSMDCFSCNGTVADTIGFSGEILGEYGIYEGFDEVAYSVTIHPDPADTGKVICIDTVMIPEDAGLPLSAYQWEWLGEGTCRVDRVVPTWYAAPLCFTVVKNECCTGLTGNVNCSEADAPDISDITTLIDHLYLTKKPLCCLEEADVNGSG